MFSDIRHIFQSQEDVSWLDRFKALNPKEDTIYNQRIKQTIVELKTKPIPELKSILQKWIRAACNSYLFAIEARLKILNGR